MLGRPCNGTHAAFFFESFHKLQVRDCIYRLCCSGTPPPNQDCNFLLSLKHKMFSRLQFFAYIGSQHVVHIFWQLWSRPDANDVCAGLWPLFFFTSPAPFQDMLVSFLVFSFRQINMHNSFSGYLLPIIFIGLGRSALV